MARRVPPPAAQPAGHARDGLHRGLRRRGRLRPVIAPYDPQDGPRPDRFQPPSGEHLGGPRQAGSRRVQPGPLRAPGSASSAGVVSVIIGVFIGGLDRRARRRPRRQGRHGPDARRRRHARDPGHPARDRHRGLARPGPAADHASRSPSPTSPIFARILRGSLLVAARSRTTSPRPARSARRRGACSSGTCCPNSLTAADRRGHAGAGDGDHRRRRPRLPGPRPARPAHAGVGDDADRLDRSSCATRRGSSSFPGIAIVISAIGFNLLGDGLRESLDPRLKR